MSQIFHARTLLYFEGYCTTTPHDTHHSPDQTLHLSSSYLTPLGGTHRLLQNTCILRVHSLAHLEQREHAEGRAQLRRRAHPNKRRESGPSVLRAAILS